MGRQRFLITILLGSALALASAPTAGALSLSLPAIALAAANTANALTTSGNNRSQVSSSLGVVSAPSGASLIGAGASDGFETRYAGLLAVDREAAGGSRTSNATASYTIAFTVDNPTGAAFQLDIETSRFGTIALVSDSTGNASATLGAVTGLLNGVADPALGLLGVAPITSAVTTSVPVAQSGSTLSLASSAVGSQVFTLAFTWSATATSSRDEAALRFGMAGNLPGVTADDSPGPLTADGHFVRVALTSVPEPGTLLLLASGLLLLAGRSSRLFTGGESEA